MKTKSCGLVLGTLACIYACFAVIGALDGPLFAHDGHGGHLPKAVPTAMITMHVGFCEMGGMVFAGPNQMVTVNGEGSDTDCANGMGGGDYQDPVTLTWEDSESMAMGMGAAFDFTTACPAMDTVSMVDLTFQDDGVHAGGMGIQELAVPGADGTLDYEILVPTGAVSGAAMPVACAVGTFGARSTFTTTVNARAECAVCWSGIRVGEPATAIMNFVSTCEFPNMEDNFVTGGSGAVGMGGAVPGADNVGGCLMSDIAFAMICAATYTIDWLWDCDRAMAPGDMPMGANHLQTFSYSFMGTAGNAMTMPVGGINSWVIDRTPH